MRVRKREGGRERGIEIKRERGRERDKEIKREGGRERCRKWLLYF